MALGEDLTTEKLKTQFKNNFELANYAIRVVRHMVRSGKELQLDDLLEELSEDPSKYSKDELEAQKNEEMAKKAS